MCLDEVEKIVLESRYIYIVKFNFPSGLAKTIRVDFSGQRGILLMKIGIHQKQYRLSDLMKHQTILNIRFGSEISQRRIVSCTRTHNLSLPVSMEAAS